MKFPRRLNHTRAPLPNCPERGVEPCHVKFALVTMLNRMYDDHEEIYDKYHILVEDIIPQSVPPTRREKRTLIDLSSPLKSVFGIARASDVQRIAESVHELHDAQVQQQAEFQASVDKLTSAVSVSSKRIDILHDDVDMNHEAILTAQREIPISNDGNTVCSRLVPYAYSYVKWLST